MAIPRYSNSFEPERVALDRLLVTVDAAVSEAVLRDLAVEHRDMPLRMGTMSSELSGIYPQMLFSMRAFLLKSKHVDMKTISVSFPATWWDHLKDDFLKSEVNWKVWLAKQFASPQYVTKSEEYAAETRVCPHNDTYVSESKQHVEFLLWRETK